MSAREETTKLAGVDSWRGRDGNRGDVGSGCEEIQVYIQEFDACSSHSEMQYGSIPGHLTHPDSSRPLIMPAQRPLSSKLSFVFFLRLSPSRCLTRTLYLVPQSMLLGWRREKPRASAILSAVFLD
jgi:hypothetical protein